MSNYKTIFIIGFIILVFPFLGFPVIFELFINSILAISLMFMAIVKKLQTNQGSKNTTESFEEHKPETSDLNNVDNSESENVVEEIEEIKEEIVEEIEDEVEDLVEEIEDVENNLESARDLLERLEMEQKKEIEKVQNDNKETE
jgi:type III secretory pathway component EscV